MSIFDDIECAVWKTNPYFWQAVAGVNAARDAHVINNADDCKAASQAGSAVAEQFEIPTFLSDSLGGCVCQYVFSGGDPNAPSEIRQAWNYKQVAYLTPDGHVWELTCNAGNWTKGDLTAITGAPPAADGSALTSYIWPGYNYKQVAYFTPDGHVWELTCNSGNWTKGDLTAITGAPSAATNSALTSYIWNGYKQVAYLTPDGHVWELTCNAGNWTKGDLTAITGAPTALAESALTSYIWNGDPGQDPRVSAKQVAYETPDGHIQELTCVAGNWTEADLSAITGAPGAVADALLTSYIWR